MLSLLQMKISLMWLSAGGSGACGDKENRSLPLEMALVLSIFTNPGRVAKFPQPGSFQCLEKN